MPLTPYGNAPNGDYPALFTGCFEAKYPKASRLIFGFTILNADRETPHDGPNGEGLYAVAICNKSDGTSPKSKPFKIRRAMLQPEEFKDLKLAINPPPPEHFTEPYDDRYRILEIRVARRRTDGKQVSVVTHIRRPRDGEWQCIEGEYEGSAATELECEPEADRQSVTSSDVDVAAEVKTSARPSECREVADTEEQASGVHDERDMGAEEPEFSLEVLAEPPFWLREDGTADPDADVIGTLSSDEFREYITWNGTTVLELKVWRNEDGTLRVLRSDEFKALDDRAQTDYRIARRRAALGWPPFG